MPSAILKPPDEMARLFRDAPEAIEETLRLSEALTFSLDELRYEYPDETIDGFANAQDALDASHLPRRRPALPARPARTRCAPASSTNSR